MGCLGMHAKCSLATKYSGQDPYQAKAVYKTHLYEVTKQDTIASLQVRDLVTAEHRFPLHLATLFEPTVMP